MKGRTILTILVIVLGIAALVYLSIEQNETKKELEALKLAAQNASAENSVPNNGPKEIIILAKKDPLEPTDYSTTQQDILNSDIVKDLPKGAVLNLKFYNFNSGAREWEKSYILKTNSVEEGEAESDMDVIIASKYVPYLKTESTCDVLITAKNNDDFGVETEMSDSALMWKYKSMLKYKECLGM